MLHEEQPYRDYDVSSRRPGFFDVDVLNVPPWPFKCSGCGSREVALWLFAKRAEAAAWVAAIAEGQAAALSAGFSAGIS